LLKPVRAVKVGMMAKLNTFVFRNLPGIADRMAVKQLKNLQRHKPPHKSEGTLYVPSEDGRTHGGHA